MNHPSRRTFLNPKWTLRQLLAKYPLAKTCFGGHFAIRDQRELDLPLRDFLAGHFKGRPYASVFRGFLAGGLNNLLGSYYRAPLQGPADWMHPDDEVAPSGFWSDAPVPVALSRDRIGIISEQGLSTAYGWASGGAWNVRYSRASGGIDHLACWNSTAGHRGSQNLFTNGGLTFGDGTTTHAFDRLTAWPFGFIDRWGAQQRHAATFCIEDGSVFFDLTSPRPWLRLAWDARLQGQETMWRQLGWDEARNAYLIHVSQMHNRLCDSVRFQPQAQGLDIAALAEVLNFKPHFDAAETPDRLQASNLFLWIAADGGAPERDIAGNLTWRTPSRLRLHIAAGTTFAEACAELQRGHGGGASAAKRERTRYRHVVTTLPILTCPTHPNLDATLAIAPLFLEALKLPGNDKLRYGPGTSSYVDTHTSLMAMRGILFHGDVTVVERYLMLLAAPRARGEQGQIATNLFHDWSVDQHLQDWVFNDVTWLALIGHLHWHSRARHQHAYTAGRTHLLRILRDCDPTTGLFASRGYWPDHPLRDVGRNGSPWPALEAGVWYEALRNWEVLAAQRHDTALASRLRRVARRIQASFVPLYFTPEVNLFCDSVDPRTRTQHPQYSLFGLHFLHGMFGHELLDLETARRAADAAFRGFYDPTWKLFRTCLGQGDFHSPFEYIYMHWMQGLAKLFRMAGHKDGLRAIADSYAFHIGKFRNFPENFNMKTDLTLEEHSAGGWFIETLGTRSQVILEGLHGITVSPYTLSVTPTGWDGGPSQVRNLSLGKSRWDIVYINSGRFLASCLLNGKAWRGSCVLPGRLLRQGAHTLTLGFSDHPPGHPMLLDATGVDLVSARITGTTLQLRLKGPGRTNLRLCSPRRPHIQVDGRIARHTWHADALHAEIPVSIASGQTIAVTVTIPA